MSEPRILVVGEKFIDRYYIGTATRLSPEAPIPVVAVKQVIQRNGGAANVLSNLVTLGAIVYNYYPDAAPTKNRLIANGHQLARWDENDDVLPLDFSKESMFDVDAMIISDYNKGAFNGKNLQTLKALCSKVKYVFIDTKRDPNSFSFYPSETFFFPNIKEFEAHSDSYYETKNVIRTESENGMTYVSYGQGKLKQPALTRPEKVVSVCGAGDTAIAAFAYAYCKEPNISKAMVFSSQACAVVVRKPYTATVSHEEINALT